MAGSEKIRLVYILSASHSGSTLLSMLLGSHPEICTVGELKATSLGNTEHYLCSCKERIKHCRFWSGIAADMAARGIVFDVTDAGTDIRSGASRYVRWLLRPLHRSRYLESFRDLALCLSPTWRTQLPKIQNVNINLLKCILARTGKRIIVDSSKIGIRLKYLLRNPALDVLVIRLIRDGRGVSLTYTNPAQFADAVDPRYRGGGTGGGRQLERLSIAAAAWEWQRSNEEAEAILKHLDRSRWIEVRYETLCTERDQTLQKLFNFIGVEPVGAISDFRSLEHHILGNGMRFDSCSEIQLDDRWRIMLNASDLEIFGSIAGKMNRQLGYV